MRQRHDHSGTAALGGTGGPERGRRGQILRIIRAAVAKQTVPGCATRVPLSRPVARTGRGPDPRGQGCVRYAPSATDVRRFCVARSRPAAGPGRARGGRRGSIGRAGHILCLVEPALRSLHDRPAALTSAWSLGENGRAQAAAGKAPRWPGGTSSAARNRSFVRLQTAGLTLRHGGSRGKYTAGPGSSGSRRVPLLPCFPRLVEVEMPSCRVASAGGASTGGHHALKRLADYDCGLVLAAVVSASVASWRRTASAVSSPGPT